MRQYSVDETFFESIDSEAKAYWLGFIAADGCVQKHLISLELSMVDEAHLLRFRDAIRSTHPIYRRPDRAMCAVAFSNKRMRLSLMALGIVPRKTYSLAFPGYLRADLTRHYMRGYFDGDGTAPGYFGVVGRLEFIAAYQDVLVRECGVSRNVMTIASRYARIHYGGRLQIRRIFGFLYDGATVFLERKHDSLRRILDRKMQRHRTVWRKPKPEHQAALLI